MASAALRRLCWLPLASLVAIELYVGNFDGYGAWAAAPLLLLPAIVSLPFVVLGVSDLRAARHAGMPARATAWMTFIAAVPLLWLPIRRYVF